MKKVLLGMSGGTDSAVSAAVLKNMGYEVTGCHLILGSDSEAESARRAAKALGIEFITEDYSEIFEKAVISYFRNEYLSGRTPNPCIRCNPQVKFHALIECAEKYGADFTATGHYAGTEYSKKYGGTVIKASPSKKDQSYFLSGLKPCQIEKIIFPLGDFRSKDEVREYGKELSLPCYSKPDSQEICFIPGNDYAGFISSGCKDIVQEGNFIDNSGNIIGRHSGIINYTVGQRKGLGAFGEPMYVKRINARDNTVMLCRKDERFSGSVRVKNISWAVKNFPQGDFSAEVKIRSTARAQRAEIEISGEEAFISFENPVLAPCPGQTAAFYDGDTVLGSAEITDSL